MQSQGTVLVFDVNGTLLDTRALAPPLRRIFGGKLMVECWFNQVVQYSMALTLTDHYREFGDIAISVLRMAAESHRVKLREKDIESIRRSMKELPPFPEVNRALGRLREANFRLIALSNSARTSLEEQLRHAAIEHFFDRVISVDAVRRFKPALDVYRAAALTTGVEATDMIMVTAHHWDLLGAARAGLGTAFIARPGQVLLPDSVTPQYVAKDLDDLCQELTSDRGSAPSRRMNKGLAFAGTAVAMGAVAGLVALQRRRVDGS